MGQKNSSLDTSTTSSSKSHLNLDLRSMFWQYFLSMKMMIFCSKHTCQLFLFWRNSSSFWSKKENDFIMCSCFCSNLCIVMYRKFRNVPLFKFFSLICSSFWNLKVGKYVKAISQRSDYVTRVMGHRWASNRIKVEFDWIGQDCTRIVNGWKFENLSCLHFFSNIFQLTDKLNRIYYLRG